MFTRLVRLPLAALTVVGLLLGSAPTWAGPGTDNPAALPAPPRTLEQLRAALALTQQQQVLWQAYLERVHAYTQVHSRMRPAQATGTETATRQFAHLIDQLQNRLAALEDIEQAVVALYASLTPEQRKLADQQLYTTLPVFASAAGASPVSPQPAHGPRTGDGPPEDRTPRGQDGGSF